MAACTGLTRRSCRCSAQTASYIAIRTEITQRKLLEERNAEMVDELLAANRELTDYGDTLGEEGSHQINLIASRVKRLSGLLVAILAYSRAGRDQADRLPVAAEPLVRNTIDLLAAPPHIRIDIVGELPGSSSKR
jgi:hypothetical protein